MESWRSCASADSGRHHRGLFLGFRLFGSLDCGPGSGGLGLRKWRRQALLHRGVGRVLAKSITEIYFSRGVWLSVQVIEK